MKRVAKRKLSSVAAVAGASSSVLTETQKKRRKISPRTAVPTKKVQKSASVRDPDPTASGGSQPPREDTATGYACPICLESTRKNEMTSLQCFHAFHRACINEWLTENRRCPVCRQEADLPQDAEPAEPPQDTRPPAPQNAGPSVRPRNARSSAPPQNARSRVPPRNARPPANNQRQMVVRELQALPGITIGRNIRLTNGGIDMALNSGSFLTIDNNGIDMRLNVGGFEVRLNNGGFMILNNR